MEVPFRTWEAAPIWPLSSWTSNCWCPWLSVVGELLHQAAETHHQVFRITDGADDDWASWYADWLVTLSELPELLGAKVVRSELTYLLVRLDKEYTKRRPDQRWEDYYARELVRHFGPSCGLPSCRPSPVLELPTTDPAVERRSCPGRLGRRSSRPRQLVRMVGIEALWSLWHIIQLSEPPTDKGESQCGTGHWAC